MVTEPPTAVQNRTEMDSNSTQLADIVSDTNELQTDWANGGRLDLILDARMAEASINTTGGAMDNVTLTATTTAVTNRVTANTDQIAGSANAATQLSRSAATIVNGTAQTGTLSTTQMTTNLTEATNDHYNGRIVIWTSGNLQNQASDITDYDGGSNMITYTAVTEAPSNNDTFIIV
jgi:hypothetical protein